MMIDDYTGISLSSARCPRSTFLVFSFHVFLSFADSCSLIVSLMKMALGIKKKQVFLIKSFMSEKAFICDGYD